MKRLKQQVVSTVKAMDRIMLHMWQAGRLLATGTGKPTSPHMLVLTLAIGAAVLSIATMGLVRGTIVNIVMAGLVIAIQHQFCNFSQKQ